MTLLIKSSRAYKMGVACLPAILPRITSMSIRIMCWNSSAPKGDIQALIGTRLCSFHNKDPVYGFSHFHFLYGYPAGDLYTHVIYDTFSSSIKKYRILV